MNTGLDRREVLKELFPDHDDYLFVSGLGGTSHDMSVLTRHGDHLYPLGGAMGAAVSVGLGLAIAVPQRKVATVTGDGELLMNLGALATAAVVNPRNFTVVCIDNGHYGETGNQLSHTGAGVDLAVIARGAGFQRVLTIGNMEDCVAARAALKEQFAATFILARVDPTQSKPVKRDLDAAARRLTFRRSAQAAEPPGRR